jgi:hypothetical protein
MTHMLPAAFAARYLAEREKLLQAFPELAEDELALQDTLAGITNAEDVIAGLIRDAREDTAMAEAVEKMIDEMCMRQNRLSARAARRKQAALNLMEACDLRKIEQPDFTASIRATQQKVEITDEAALPDSMFRIKREPDKTAIKEALGKGPLPGAHMSNGGATLTVRTR